MNPFQFVKLNILSSPALQLDFARYVEHYAHLTQLQGRLQKQSKHKNNSTEP
jgi:hypothetical protein